MKEKMIMLPLCLMALSPLNAQLTVDTNGKVAIGIPSANGNVLNVCSSTSSSAAMFQGGTNCISMYNEGVGTNRSGIDILNVYQSGQSVRGINVTGYGSATTGEVFGMKSIAGYSNTVNYGVYGALATHSSTNNGAGIFGSSFPTASISTSYQGKYAGYFNGDVRVTGSLYGTLLTPTSVSTSSSESRTETELISRVTEEENVSDKLRQVQLLQFYRSPDANKFTPEEIQTQRDYILEIHKTAMKVQNHNESVTKNAFQHSDKKSKATSTIMDDIEMEIVEEIPQTKLNAIGYGLAADQLKAVYPELVYEDQNGNTSINYIEMIPLLVQAVNEIKAENLALRAEIAELKGETTIESKPKTANETTTIRTVDGAVFSLSQNKPNPFSSSTSIEVSVPEPVTKASIFIYDMSGKQVKCFDISKRGVSYISVVSDDLEEGMYLYSLIADGNLIASKKMFLTKY